MAEGNEGADERAAKEGKCEGCSDKACPSKNARAEESPEEFHQRQALELRMCGIQHKILVLSGKGGVGKSTVAANLAVSLSIVGKRVGLLDVDIHGPSIPKMLNLEDRKLQTEDGAVVPVSVGKYLKVISIGFLLPNADTPVVWLGPLKRQVIRQFLKDVEWGELDYLIVDCPPGTGDEPLAAVQLIGDADGAVIVTTPQAAALANVRKCITFCREVNLPVLGVIENMSGFVCPKCGERTEVFGSGGGERMASELGLAFLGRIPLDPQMVEACDKGQAFVYFYGKTETAKAFEGAVEKVLESVAKGKGHG